MSSSSSKTSAKSSKSLLVVFDIDETLLQFIPKKYASIWEQRESAFRPEQYVVKGGNIIIFRPWLEDLFAYLQKNRKFFKVALWTLSEREYCDDIATVLTNRFGLRSNFFLSKKGYEDNDEDAPPKDLTQFWREYPQYNTFNTVLIDDRYANMNHAINRRNGIAIQPFAPFGTEKQRELLPESEFAMQLRDDVFKNLIDILEKMKADIKGCTSSEVVEALTTESLITPQRIKRMKLDAFMQPFATKMENIMRIGMPYVTHDYALVKRSATMHGGRKKSKKTRKNRKS
jgi:hypothetical protein